MAQTSLRYLAMLRLVPRFPEAVTAREISDQLEQQALAVNLRSVQRDPEKLSVHFPLISDESARPFRWSFDARTTPHTVAAMDVSAGPALEIALDNPVPGQQHANKLRPQANTLRNSLDNFDLDCAMHSGGEDMLNAKQLLYLQLRCDRPHLSHLLQNTLSNTLGPDQTVSGVSGEQFYLDATLRDSQELRRWLVAHARHLDILAPGWLREEITQELSLALSRSVGSQLRRKRRRRFHVRFQAGR